MTITPSSPVHIALPGRVGETVASELALALGNEKAKSLRHTESPSPAQIVAGSMEHHPYADELVAEGLVDLHNVPASLDAFEVLTYADRLILIGNTPRGTLQAVYELADMLDSGETITDDLRLRRTIRFETRFYHPRFDYWPGTRADVRYISRIGASHCLHTHDWQGERRRFSGYVESSVFRDASDPDTIESGRTGLRRLIDDNLDYGLETAMWITELPCQGGGWVPEAERQAFLDRYPAEVLSDSGTNQGKVLCFGRLEVRRYYRDLIERFFADFPEVSVLFVMGLDAGGEFCDPDSCPQCRGMGKFAQRDRFLRFLIEEGTRVRPGLKVLTTSWGWYRIDPNEFLRRQAELPSEAGLFMAAQVDGWQPERQLHEDMIRARKICRTRGQLFVGYDDFHWGDDTVHHLADIQDYPLGIGAKLDRWSRLGADGVFDHWGTRCNEVSCNSIACREFSFNPAADRSTICRRIAAHQYGAPPADEVLTAWSSLDRAHAILSNTSIWPPQQWPNWYRGLHPPVPEEFARRPLTTDPRWEVRAGTVVYNPAGGGLSRVGDAWRRAVPHYAEASAALDRAISEAPEKPIGYAGWWRGEVPTIREHLRRERLYIESMRVVGREIGIHFELHALSVRVNHDRDAFLREAGTLLGEDAEACREAAAFFRSCFAAGDYPESKRSIVTDYEAKASAIEALLNVG